MLTRQRTYENKRKKQKKEEAPEEGKDPKS